MEQNRRRGNGWVGWVIFVVLIFGSRFMPPIAAWLSQVTGLQISAPMLIAAVVGLGVLSTIVGSIGQEIARNRRSNETSLPTGLPQQMPPTAMRPPPTPAPPTQPRAGGPPLRPQLSEQRLPGPPRFEPIIDPRVLTFGIIGLALFGVCFLAILAFSGALP